VIVVDSSAIVHAFAVAEPDEDLLQTLSTETLHAPHLLDAEVLHALRGLELGAKISNERANHARDAYHQLAIERYAMNALAERVWMLRRNLTAYDAVYVALAEALDCPLATTDTKLGSATGHRAEVRQFAWA
jgi:predicted nucleic acid-binding protein